MATYRDIAETPDTNDLVIVGNDLVLVADAKAIAQQCEIALTTFAGEVFFDTTAGAQWFDLLAQKGVGNSAFQTEVRRVLALVPGIASVQNVTAVRDASSRSLAMTAQCTTDLGELLTVSTTTQV